MCVYIAAGRFGPEQEGRAKQSVSDQGGAAVDDDDRLVELADRLRYTIRIEDTNECMWTSGPNESKARRVGRGGVSVGRAGSGAKQHTLASLTDRRGVPASPNLGSKPDETAESAFPRSACIVYFDFFSFFFLSFFWGWLLIEKSNCCF